MPHFINEFIYSFNEMITTTHLARRENSVYFAMFANSLPLILFEHFIHVIHHNRLWAGFVEQKVKG